MNITKKIIITDTNIITDLNNACVLDKFVKLDNVYINDMVKNDEIKDSTGNRKIIDKFKTIGATAEQIVEVNSLSQVTSGLSTYDLANYVISRDNNGILATGDQKLKIFSEKNGVEVIRTLKIIELMKEYNVISNDEAISACILLKNNECTRIPFDEIDKIIKKIEKDKAKC